MTAILRISRDDSVAQVVTGRIVRLDGRSIGTMGPEPVSEFEIESGYHVANLRDWPFEGQFVRFRVRDGEMVGLYVRAGHPDVVGAVLGRDFDIDTQEVAR